MRAGACESMFLPSPRTLEEHRWNCHVLPCRRRRAPTCRAFWDLKSGRWCPRVRQRS